jgi:hypothetical protein
MSDQHVVTDWKAYFASLGPGTPSPSWSAFTPMYAGEPHCSVTFALPSGDLDSRDMPAGENLLEWAREVWEANGRPEMWVFLTRGGPPWHVPAQPAAKPQKGRRSSRFASP